MVFSGSSFGPLGLGSMTASYNRNAPNVACTFNAADHTSVFSIGDTAPAVAPGKLALWSANAETAFQYVFVVSRP